MKKFLFLLFFLFFVPLANSDSITAYKDQKFAEIEATLKKIINSATTIEEAESYARAAIDSLGSLKRSELLSENTSSYPMKLKIVNADGRFLGTVTLLSESDKDKYLTIESF